MTEAMLFRFRGREINQLLEAAESWKTDHDCAMTAYDMEDLVTESLKLEANVRQLLRRTWERCAGQAEAVRNEANETIKEILIGSNYALTKVLNAVTRFSKATGHSVAGADKLRESQARLDALAKRDLSEWLWDYPEPPAIDRDMIRRSDEAFGRGEGEDLHEVLDRMMSH
jgi:hypothetical protein